MGKSLKKRNIAASRNNKAITAEVLTNGKAYLYGRIIKALGFCQFEVRVSDGRTCTATIPGAFKKTLYISADQIVVLEDSSTEGLNLLIKGVLSKQDAHTLYKKDYINKCIYLNDEELEEEEEQGFEFDYSNCKEEDEIDVDAI
jgi:translation initiation factor IF-1